MATGQFQKEKALTPVTSTQASELLDFDSLIFTQPHFPLRQSSYVYPENFTSNVFSHDTKTTKELIQSSDTNENKENQEVELPCPFMNCKKTFQRKHNLKSHLRIHDENKPYTCTMENCSQSFRRNHDLKRHFRLHTKEKPYSCGTCNAKFSRSDALKLDKTGCGSEKDSNDDLMPTTFHCSNEIVSKITVPIDRNQSRSPVSENVYQLFTPISPLSPKSPINEAEMMNKKSYYNVNDFGLEKFSNQKFRRNRQSTEPNLSHLSIPGQSFHIANSQIPVNNSTDLAGIPLTPIQSASPSKGPIFSIDDLPPLSNLVTPVEVSFTRRWINKKEFVYETRVIPLSVLPN
ncbi:hypothetical protein HK096_010615 [Nowakowskiella sp. JEL0078]|nr:hypothetical protein HK096_010615 [Nowakowskiella sp. JEL0078]